MRFRVSSHCGLDAVLSEFHMEEGDEALEVNIKYCAKY